MGMEIGEAQMLEYVSRFLWPLFRIGAFLMVMPIVGTRLVSMRIRAGLATLMAILVSPNLPNVPVVDLLSLQSYVITAEQILIGVSMAFLIQVMFQIFILALVR